MAKLLFYDTFTNDPSDDCVRDSWSAIDFSCPIVLEEILVVPQGGRLGDHLASDG